MNTATSTPASSHAPSTTAEVAAQQNHQWTEVLHQHLAHNAREARTWVQKIEAKAGEFGRVPLPAPMVYDLLADLVSIGHSLGHTFELVAADLAASHEVYDLVNDDDTDPADTLDLADILFAAAVVHAAGIGHALEDLRAELSVQGYRLTKPSRASRYQAGAEGSAEGSVEGGDLS